MAKKFFDVDSIMKSMASGNDPNQIPYQKAMIGSLQRRLDDPMPPNVPYESPLATAMINDVMSGKTGQIPYQQVMTEVPNRQSPILEDMINEAMGGQQIQIPYRPGMGPNQQITDAIQQQQAAPMPTLNLKKSVGLKKNTYSPFPPNAAPSQVTPQDDLMAQLEAAMKAKQAAISGNVDQNRALMEQLGNYKASPTFGGLYDYVNAMTGSNIRPSEGDSANTRMGLLSRLQQEVAKGKEAATAPGIDIAEAKIKMREWQQEMENKNKEAAFDRDIRSRLLKEQIAGRLQVAALAKGSQPTPLDRKTAASYGEFITKDAPQAMDDLASLDDAISRLQQNPGLSGAVGKGGLSKVPILGPILAEDTKATQQRVHNVIYSTLKPLLGSQFTAQEGEILKNLSFDPMLSASENIVRIGNLEKRIKDILAAKQDMYGHFERNNWSMAGYKGVGGMDTVSTKQSAPQATPSAQKSVDQMSEAELDAFLASKRK